MGIDKKETDGSKAAQSTKLTITVKITLPDGSEVVRGIEAEEGIPSPDQIDVSTTKENFLRSFEVLEKSILEARNRTGEAIIGMMADEIKKRRGGRSDSYRRERVGRGGISLVKGDRFETQAKGTRTECLAHRADGPPRQGDELPSGGGNRQRIPAQARRAGHEPHDIKGQDGVLGNADQRGMGGRRPALS